MKGDERRTKEEERRTKREERGAKREERRVEREERRVEREERRVEKSEERRAKREERREWSDEERIGCVSGGVSACLRRCGSVSASCGPPSAARFITADARRLCPPRERAHQDASGSHGDSAQGVHF